MLPVFFAFRAMVGIGVLMLATAGSAASSTGAAAGTPARLPRGLLGTFAAMTFAGWLATLCGWYVTEIGRQPWTVHGLIRTADIVAKVPASNIALTLTLYVVLYVSLLVAYVTVLKYMAEKSEAVLETEAEERNRQPPGIATSPVVGPTSP